MPSVKKTRKECQERWLTLVEKSWKNSYKKTAKDSAAVEEVEVKEEEVVSAKEDAAKEETNEENTSVENKNDDVKASEEVVPEAAEAPEAPKKRKYKKRTSSKTADDKTAEKALQKRLKRTLSKLRKNKKYILNSAMIRYFQKKLLTEFKKHTKTRDIGFLLSKIFRYIWTLKREKLIT